MSFSLEPAPELQGELVDLARRRQLPPQHLLDQAVSEWLAKQRTPEAAPAAPVSPMLALFAEWDTEDETDDPEELARRRREWDETRASLEANRLTLRDVRGLANGDKERGEVA